MPVLLSFHVLGGQAVKAGLAAIQAAMHDLRPYWKEVFAPKYFGMVQDLFATQGRKRGPGGRFAGGAWAPLSPKYAIWKAKNYPGRGLLQLRGELQESVRWTGSSLGPGGIFEAHPSFVIAGTRVKHARRHNEGLGNTPQREFMPTPDPAVFAPLMQQWILRAQRGGK